MSSPERQTVEDTKRRRDLVEGPQTPPKILDPVADKPIDTYLGDEHRGSARDMSTSA